MRRLRLWLLVAGVGWASCSDPERSEIVVGAPTPQEKRPSVEPLVVTRLGMGVRFQIALVGDDDRRLEAIASDAFAEVDRLEKILNNWDRESAVSRFNRAAGVEWNPVPEELAFVVSSAIEMHDLTEGAYDITILPALEAYGFGSHATRVPSESELSALRARVGSRLLEVRIDPPAIRRKVEGVTIDVSSAAKGFAVDRVIAILRARGVVNAFVSAGGSSVAALGPGLDGSGWPLELDFATVWRLHDESVSTSGRSDDRDAVVSGRKLGHVFDPRTLRPADRRVEMVSIRGSSGLVVDMASTALMVSGPDAGIRWIRSAPDLSRCAVRIRLVGEPDPIEFGPGD